MKSDLIEKERNRIQEKYDKSLTELSIKEEFLNALPSVIDKRFMPRIYVAGVGLAKKLGWSAQLHFGDQYSWDDIEPYVSDTEVSILMAQYPPVPMVMRIQGSKSFRPTTQEIWDGYWIDNIVDNDNGTTTEMIPVAPFTFNMETAPYGTKTVVKWFTVLNGVHVICSAHLNPGKDPSYFRTKFAYRPTRVVIRDAVPQLAGTYTPIRRWSSGDDIAKYTFYWGHPSEDDRDWGSVIDFTARNEARE